MIEAGWQEFAQARAQVVRELAEAAFENDNEGDGKKVGKIMTALCKQQEVADCLTRETWTRLFDDKILQEESLYGDVLLSILDSLVDDFDSMRPYVGLAKSVGEGQGFEQAYSNISTMREKVLKNWPRLDKRRINEARAAIRRGESQDFKDAIDELEKTAAS
jgi:hypothetical protein